MVKIVIIDYGLGNLRSVHKAFKRINNDTEITKSVQEVKNADAIVIPGVGAFRDAIRNLTHLKENVLTLIEEGRPLLGICLGLHMLFSTSTEGGLTKGLDYFKGRVIRLPQELTVPHMGWNSLKIVRFENPLLSEISDDSYVYFAHSYYPVVEDEEDTIAITDYGITIPSVISKQSVFATQFHPEKSGKVGINIINNYIKYVKR
jgi:glutamine amidotransferase